MNDKRTFFLTASGILVAVLLVWAQLWFTTAQQYGEPNTITAKFGLSYVYIAILASLIAFVLILWKSVNLWSIIFIGYSLMLTFILVIGSLYSVIAKTVMKLPLLSPYTSSALAWVYNRPVLGVIVCPLVLFVFCFIVAIRYVHY